MEYPASFPIITEGLAVPFLVYDLADLTLAVIPVGNDAAVGIRGTGDMAGIIIGKVLLSSLCRLNLMYPSPGVHLMACLILVSVLDSGNPASGIIRVHLGCPVCPLAPGGTDFLLQPIYSIGIFQLISVCKLALYPFSVCLIEMLFLQDSLTVCLRYQVSMVIVGDSYENTKLK